MQSSWEAYFKRIDTGSGLRYQYIDTSVTVLPKGLPMPPTDYHISFSGCHKLVDISALVDWDTSNVTTLEGLFNHCYELADITPLAAWDTSNVTDMSYMFNCCHKLSDVTPLYRWNIVNVRKMRYIFNGCYSLHEDARSVKTPKEFSWYMDQHITPILYPVVYVDAYEEEEESSEYPPEIEMESQEIYFEPPSTPPGDDLPWTEQTMIFPGCYPPPDYSSDDDLADTDYANR